MIMNSTCLFVEHSVINNGSSQVIIKGRKIMSNHSLIFSWL
jgi:hypothetical protein